MIISIIPARGGSKGVPGKNIKELEGFPLIAYSIAASLLSDKIERTIVSTDSQEIASIASAFGAEVPFLRPSEFATDTSPDLDFIRHAIGWFRENENSVPELIVHLRPTTPLRDPALIDKAIDAISNNTEATGLRSVHELSEPPQKSFYIDNGYLEGLYPEDSRPEYYNLPRQSFRTAYYPNGYVDIIKSSTVLDTGSLHGLRMLGLITPISAEVDRIEDFEYIRFMLQKHGLAVLDYLRKNH